MIRHLWVDLVEIELLSPAFEAVVNQLRTFLIGEAVIICTYIEVSKCHVNALVGTPEDFSSFKRPSIALNFMYRFCWVEELEVVWILAGMFLVGFISVLCFAS